MKQKSLSQPARSLIALTVAVILGHGHVAAAQSRPKHFDIGSQALSTALNEFARQSDRQILFSTEIVRAKQTNGIKGELEPEAALRLLLEGTGLTFRVTSDETILVEKASPGETANIPGTGAWRIAQANTFGAGGEAGGEHGRRTGPDAEGRNGSPGSLADGVTIDVDEIVVVGTLLRNTSPTSPVLTFSRQEIERGGYTSVEDVLAKTPQNFNGVNAGTSLLTGGNLGFTTQIDLRGLGSEASLVLVNGRRISSAAGDDGRAVDISMIPISAIERIDILTDGASALYGSDAIGGVLNIVLRKDFEGSQTSVQYGDNRTGSDDLLVSQVLGTGWSTGRLLAAAQYSKNEPLTFRAIGIDTLDFRPRGGGDQRLQLIGSPGTVLPAGFFAGQPFTTLSGPGGQPVFFAALPPGDGRSLDVGQLRLNEATYDDVFVDQILPKQESASVYLTLEQDLGAITLYADGVFARRKSVFSQGLTFDMLYVPATNAFSPFAEDVMVGYSFADFGPITYDAEKDGWFVNVGARGLLGGSNWTWEITGTRSVDESDNTFATPDRAELAARLASSDPDYAFNPFGDGSGQSPGVIEAIRQMVTYDGRTTLTGVSAQTQGSLWQLPGGTARLALGAEYREEEMESGVLTEGAPEREYYPDASRDVSAVFGELYLPFVTGVNARRGARELAFSIAARYESYSDFGETANPKLGLLWRPTEDVTLRANWGTSFRAPSLRELKYISAVSPNIPVFDPNAPGGPATVFADIIQGGNPDLKEETATTHTLSLEYTPGWLEGARFSVTYFHIEYEDRIRGVLDGLDWNALLQFEESLPPGVVVRAADGTLESVNMTNLNSAHTVMSGYDASVGYFWTTDRWGSFDLGATAAFTTRYDDRLIAGAPVLDLVGRVGSVPDWRGRIHFNWSRGPWGASASVNHTDSLWNADASPQIIVRDVDSQTTVDLQLSFSPVQQSGWLHGLTARIGATNLFDERPPFVDGQQRRGLDVQNAVIEGRTVYLRLSKAFGAAAN